MIAADLVRGVLILGLLLVRRADQVWIAYVVMALSGRRRRRSSSRRARRRFPTSRRAEELLPANALSSATWSAMLAIGASVGGLVTARRRPQRRVRRQRAVVLRVGVLHRPDAVRRDAAAPRAAAAGFLALTGITDLVEGRPLRPRQRRTSRR